MRLTVVELHHKVRKVLAAINARHRAQLREELSLLPSGRSPSLEVGREARRSMSENVFRLYPVVSSNCVTVRTNDVAFRNFGEKNLSTLQKDFACGEGERLRFGIPVVEIHDPRRKDPSAVRARPTSQVTKKLERCGLAPFDPLDLFLAMLGVIEDVVETLIVRSPHTFS